jgi:tetratricopeptide (TPR) repeat protein
MGAFNTAFAAGEVGLLMAKGILAEEQNRLQDAAQYLARAVQLEDQMTYNEPKDWILPPRQYLGAVLIKMGAYQKASVIFQEDLAFNPGNGWSLKGLIACLEHTGKNKDAEMLREQLKTVVKNRNFNPNRSVF